MSYGNSVLYALAPKEPEHITLSSYGEYIYSDGHISANT